MLPCLVTLILFAYYPMVNGIYLSLCKTRAYDAIGFVGFNNYKDIFTNSMFLKSLGNSFKYVFWCFVIGYPLPVMVAILLNEIKKGQKIFRWLIYLPCIVPGVVTSILWLILLDPGQNGLLNMILGHLGFGPLQWLQDAHLVIPTIAFTITWGGYGGGVIGYLATLQAVNSDLYEAATIDGAGFFRKLINITIPHLSPHLRLALVNQVIGTFAIFQQVYIMTGGGPNYASTNLAMMSFQYAFQNIQTGHSAAISVIQSIILIIITTAFYKFTDRGDLSE